MFIISLFSVVGIIYTTLLILFSLKKGMVYMWLWSIILLVCCVYGGMFAEVEGVYKINSGDGVPVWIFNPEVLMVAPMLATCLACVFFVAKRQADRQGGWF